MPNLEVVSLSVNKISTLQPFSQCFKIQELYLRKNLVSDLSEITHLVNLKNLRVLWLSDNPCSADQYYRPTIIRLLPQLTKIDSHEISEDERMKVKTMNFDHILLKNSG
jgi:Leucine-rich repeat (LRR) protein